VKPNPDENGGELSVDLEVDEVELKGSRPARVVEVDEWEPRCIGGSESIKQKREVSTTIQIFSFLRI
jgi:hypothetical protein